MKEEDFDALLRDKMGELDNSYSKALPDSAHLWAGVESRLPGSHKTPWRYALAVAASLALLLVSLWWWNERATPEHISIRYATEPAGEPAAGTEVLLGPTEKQGLAFIDAQCQAQRPACSSSAFIELKRELDQLGRETEQLSKQLEAFGPDPALVKAETRLENHKAYLIRELIQLLQA